MISFKTAAGVKTPLAAYSNFHIRHKANGADELSFSVETNDPQYPLLAEELEVSAGGNEWLIKKIDDDRVDCRLNFDFLKSRVYSNYSSDTQPLTAVLQNHLPEGWVVVNGNISTISRTIRFDYCTDYDVVFECMATYSVYFVWDIPNKVLTVYDPTKMPATGEYLTSELNLKSLSFKGNTTDFATRLYCYGADGLTPAGAVVTGPDGQETVYGLDYVENRAYADKIVCAYWSDNRYTSAQTLYEDALEKLTELSNPVRSYKCKVIDLAKQNPAYSFLSIAMHRKMILVDVARGIKVEHQVVEYDEYPEDPTENEVTISCVPKTIQSQMQTITSQFTEEQDKMNTEMDNRIAMATAMLTGAFGGHVISRNGEIFIMDSPDPATAMVVWRWNVNGFGKSSTGIDGPYTTALTFDDTFITNVINAMVIRGDLIEASTVTADKINQSYTDGVLEQSYKQTKETAEDEEPETETFSEALSRLLDKTLTDAKAYTEAYFNAAMADYKGFTTVILDSIDELPAIGVEQTFYLVPNNSGTGYDKYWWITEEQENGTVVGKYDAFGSSSTLVVDTLPETGADDVDYILNTADGLMYYKWLDGKWQVVAGPNSLIIPTTADDDGNIVVGQLPETGNEMTDYYQVTLTGSLLHFRWVGGKYVQVGVDTTSFSDLKNRVEANTQAIDNAKTEIEALKGYVSDITQSDTGIKVSYGDGTSKEVPTKDTTVTVEDVDKTESGLRFTYTNGDTKDIEISGGSGGGSTAGGAAISRLGDAALYCIYGGECPIGFNFNAFDAAGDTVGSGVATWYVGGVAKATSTANQGDNYFDIGEYLSAGSNSVKVSITVDTGGEAPTVATKTWTVNAVNLYFTWERDDSAVATTDVALRWTPYGDLEKTTHIILNGEEIDTSVTTRSGTLQTYTLPMQSHGSHLVELYVSAVVNGTDIRTSSVYHDIIFAEEGNGNQIIASSYPGGEMTQYGTVAIPVVLYDPSSITADAVLFVNGEQAATWTGIDRTVHYWNYSPATAGDHVLKMTCGTAEKTWTIKVTALDIDNAEVEGYSFRMKASEFAGNDALRAWNSNGITAAFSENFDWENGGVRAETDSNGNIRQFICIKAGTSMTLNHKLFETECTTDGKNIKVMFRLANCRDYDAQWLTCYAGGVGIRMFAQQAVLNSEQSEVSVPYYEGTTDPIELEFDVTPKSQFSYIMPWLDGVRSGVKVYPTNDSFVQPEAVNITIGSADCDVYLYLIKAYPNNLTEDNHLENYIADAPNPQEMLDRYSQNDILDSNGKISYLRLAQQNPDCYVLLYDIVEMFKGDKEAAAITGNGFRMFLASEDTQNAILSAENVSMKIQGTSSVGYYDACANWDAEFKDGLTDKNGNHVDGITLWDGALPIDYVNHKVNQASCEGANNAILADWYNQHQAYIRPYRAANSSFVRDTMKLIPGVAFFRDQSGGLWNGDSESYNMYAVVAFGTYKKNYKVFHDPDNSMECCMEIANNTSPQCLMTVACSEEDVRNDDYFEFRYPKKPTDEQYTAWHRFVNWMAACNPSCATGEALENSVTYGAYTFKGITEDQASNILAGTVINTYAGTYTHDTYEYRMAKMLNECEDYLVMDSVTYHFLFIECFTMIDNVSKNTFWGSHDLLHWYLVHDYDNDTGLGNDNEGGLTLTYGYEAMDTIGTKNVFNGSTSAWFQFLNGLHEARRVMYLHMESIGTFNADALIQKFLDFQKVIPARVRNRDYWYKYLRRYEENEDDGYLAMLEGGLKTYQRWQFLVYQMSYMASRYIGSASSNDRITIRTYTPTTSGLVVTPKNEMTITMYAKMYITILVGSVRKQIKAERGVPYTLTFDEAGSLNDTETYIYSASMIQAIGDISHLYPGYMAFANATRLRSIQVSSTEEGYTNTNAESLTFGANKMLEEIICPNLPKVEIAMDATQLQSLRYINAQGSGFTGFAFANGGVLETALLSAPASISLRNLLYLKEFTLESYDKLTSVTVDNCPSIDTQALMNSAKNLVRVRLIGLDWTEYETEVTELLARLYTLRGRDESDSDIPQSVLAGDVYLATARQRLLDAYNLAWSDLTISYGTLVVQYALTFLNADGTAIQAKDGSGAYVQYVDRGDNGYDPIDAGEVDTPTLPSTEAVHFNFDKWDDDLTTVISDRTVNAVYTDTPRKYTVKWLGANNKVCKEAEYEYGAEAVYDGDKPTNTAGESSLTFSEFIGWDKSTARVTQDMTVNARWQTADLPIAGTSLEVMNYAQLAGVKKTGKASDYFEQKARIPFVMGYEPEFDNVESVLLAENLELDGATIVDTGVKLLDVDRDWTMVVDGVFDVATAESCMVACFTKTGYHGFKVKYNSGFAVQWSTNTKSNANATTTTTIQDTTTITARYRELAVLRHVKGSNNLIVYMSKPGSLAIDKVELNKTITTVSDATIVFGGDNEGENYATGTLFRCKLWYGDLGDDECQKMAAWPREECYLEAITVANGVKTSGGKTNIDFIHAGLMCGLHRMNPSNTNAGGWPETEMRTWMQSRYYPALPEPLRDMLEQVHISSVGYVDGTNHQIYESDDFVYPAAYRDFSGSNSEPWIYTGEWIPWFTSNAKRIKFVGITIPEDATFTSQQLPPSDPKIGDVWIATSNDSYGYIWNGRFWIRAQWYWLRDSSVAYSYGFYYVYYGGSVNNFYPASNSAGVLPRLHI